MVDDNSYQFQRNETDQRQRDFIVSSFLSALSQKLSLDQGQETKTAEDTLSLLQRPEWYVRAQAIYQLEALDEMVAVEAIMTALDDEDPSVRIAALHVYSKLDTFIPIETLVRTLHDPDWQVREIAAQTLGKRREEKAVHALQEALSDSDILVQQAAKRALVHTSTMPLPPTSNAHQTKHNRQIIAHRPSRWLIAAVAALLIACLLLPETRVLASQVFASIRILYFQAVQENTSPVPARVFPSLQDLGTIQVQGFKTQGSLSPSQAAQLVTFPLHLPPVPTQGVSTVPNYVVTRAGRIIFTFHAKMAQTYLDHHGYTDIPIPARLEGATFTIDVGSSVVINYTHQAQVLQITEMPAPVITVSPGASVNDLRDFLLSLPGTLSPQVLKQMMQVDLNSGVVPVIVDAQTTVHQEDIQGNPGLFLEHTSGNTLNQLIWQAQGIIYTIESQKEGPEQLLSLARSLL